MAKTKDFSRRYLPSDPKRADLSNCEPRYAQVLAGARSKPLPWGMVPGRDDRSQHAWVWIEGDSLEHRDTIIGAGARWSKKRQQYYIPGVDQLPAALELAGLRGKVCKGAK